MAETLFVSSVYSELPKIVEGLVICAIFYGIIRWIRSYYLTKWPFKLKLLKQKNCTSIRQKFFSKKIIIKTISPEIPEYIELKISPRKKLIFEQVGLKLEKKRWYGASEPKDIVSIKEVIDLDIQNTEIHNRYKTDLPTDSIKTLFDGKGGIDIQYNPPRNCPKGGSLLLKIELFVKVKEKWKGYINFKHIRGDDYQGCARLPLEICLVNSFTSV